jgi:hypothetical protein
MRILIIGVVLAAALGFTVKDMASSPGAAPTSAWEDRAGGMVSEDTHERLSETGADIREWLLEQLEESQAQ